jgi:hypothetical protein
MQFNRSYDFARVGKGTRARAGLLGECLLTANKESWPAYRDALAEAGHDPAAARMAGGVQGWVSEDPEADWPDVARHVGYQLDSYRRHMAQGTDAPVPARTLVLLASDDAATITGASIAIDHATTAGGWASQWVHQMIARPSVTG